MKNKKIDKQNFIKLRLYRMFSQRKESKNIEKNKRLKETKSKSIIKNIKIASYYIKKSKNNIKRRSKKQKSNSNKF